MLTSAACHAGVGKCVLIELFFYTLRVLKSGIGNFLVNFDLLISARVYKGQSGARNKSKEKVDAISVIRNDFIRCTLCPSRLVT